MADPENDAAFDLPRFRAALQRERPPTSELPNDTYYRYVRGHLPRRFVQLLRSRPTLARAFCDDLIGDESRAA